MLKEQSFVLFDESWSSLMSLRSTEILKIHRKMFTLIFTGLDEDRGVDPIRVTSIDIVEIVSIGSSLLSLVVFIKESPRH